MHNHNQHGAVTKQTTTFVIPEQPHKNVLWVPQVMMR